MHTIFGTKHLILIGISLAVITGLYLFVRKKPLEKLYRPLLLIGLTPELIKVFCYILANEAEHGGIPPKTDLPFYLCSIQILFVVLLVFSNSARLRSILLNSMLPSCLFGRITAILIATTSSLNVAPILNEDHGWLVYIAHYGRLVLFCVTLCYIRPIWTSAKGHLRKKAPV